MQSVKWGLAVWRTTFEWPTPRDRECRRGGQTGTNLPPERLPTSVDEHSGGVSTETLGVRPRR